MKLLTEDDVEVEYEIPFWIVCIQNHSFNIGTPQELKLYKPYQSTIHQGAGFNRFGLKLFSTKSAAEKWCDLFIICKTCDHVCYRNSYDVFGCPNCQKKEYDEMQNQSMNIKNDID